MKLIEVILSNCFPPQEEQDIREVPRMGLAHIFVDFQRSPDANNSDHVDLIDHCIFQSKRDVNIHFLLPWMKNHKICFSQI